jgi:cell division protease FtsH
MRGAIVVVAVLLLLTLLTGGLGQGREISITDFWRFVEAGDVTGDIIISKDSIIGENTKNVPVPDGEPYKFYVQYNHVIDEKFSERLDNASRKHPGKFDVKFKLTGWWELMLPHFLMTALVFLAIWFFVFRRMGAGGAGGGMLGNFGRSKHRLTPKDQTGVTFGDVAGVEEAKDEVKEIIEFLQNPQKFRRLGGRIPRGVLLAGEPGCGKTLLAKAIAGEADVPFFSISGSDFVEMFVGVGASRVRDLFQQGKKQAPCIIFIDEIDAVGRHRGAGMGGGHDEREQTLNQLLVEMDGFESNEGVILIAATNRPDVLDPALLRPGRFDRRVVVPRPDLRGRLAILKIHTRRVPLEDDVDLELQARGTPGMVGADLQNLVNEAALLAARRDATRVAHQDFENAKDKVLMGAERRSMIMSDEDKRVTAFHEAGHALVAMLTPDDSDPVHKVTIIPRGMALGLTQTLPEEDRLNYTEQQIYAVIRYAMGGRAAEDIVFHHFSTGASNDLQQATSWARKMVTEYGMSEGLGPVSYGDSGADVFLGRDLVSRKDYSEQKAREIDDEISEILSKKYDEARQLLVDHRDVLDRFAEALLERETLEGSQLQLLLKGEALPGLPPVEESSSTESPSGSRGERDDDSGRTGGQTSGNIPDPEPMPS